MLPRARGQAIVPRQRVRQDAEVGSALDVIVTAEDVGAAARFTHVTQGQLEVTVGTGVVVANGVLSTTHAPNEGARSVICHDLGSLVDQLFTHASHIMSDVGRPVGNLLLDIVHPPDPLVNELFIFPTVLEDVPHNAPDNGDICSRAYLQMQVCMGCSAREARINHDQGRIVALLGTHQVNQGNRVCLSRVTTDHQHRLAIVNIVVRVGHRTVAPGVRNTSDRG